MVRKKFTVSLVAIHLILLMAAQIIPNRCWSTETLTITPNDDLDPQWSPDGTHIAFVGHHEGNPEVYVLDMVTRAMTNLSNSPDDDYNPIWSPDGQYIAFFHRKQQYSSDAIQLRLAHLAKGDITDVTPDYGYIDRGGVEWMPDSSILLFRQNAAFFIYNLATHDLHQLAGSKPQGSLFAQWPAPDGRKAIVFLRNLSLENTFDIFALDILSDQVEPIISDRYMRSVGWSQDSSRFGFVMGGYPDPISLVVYNFQTRALHEVDYTDRIGIQSASWSPDNRLAWTVSSPTNDGLPFSLFLMDAAYEQPRQLLQLNMPFSIAGWSPTRDHLAFYTYAGVYVMDISSGNFRDFIQGIGMVEKALWSPDGNYFAASLSNEWATTTQIAITDIRTGSVCVYGDNREYRYIKWRNGYRPFISSDPQWSPTGDRLVFSSSVDGNSNLILLTMST